MNPFPFLAALALAAGAFEVEGHRGARWVRPENTLAGFRYALEAGVDTLELDLHVTRDDVLVVTHDPFVNPALCLGPDGKRLERQVLVRGLTFEELRRYDCGTLINPRFPQQKPQPKERIPSFDELLAWLAKSKHPRAKLVRLNVETKSEREHPEYAPEPEAFARLVLAAKDKYKLGRRLVLQSFDFRTLTAARKLDPSVITSALIENRPEESIVEIAKTLKADIVSPNHEWLTREDVEALHQHAIKVVPWTANTEESWKRLADYGVDAIITDNPKPLLAFRAKSRK
ncbi:MAG: glycerophosphodiester phosphodiesterase [Elusimicrobia bacterium]|nr:glycerophosphodiester phosphodiesterase [Elusimicrobiota bacterium]